TAYREYKEVLDELSGAEEMLADESDAEMAEMAKLEVDELTERRDTLEEEIRLLLLPKDPNDEKNVIMEIRGAAGGDEAALFAGDLYRMYAKFAENHGWKTEVIEAIQQGLGAIKNSFSRLMVQARIQI